MTIETKAGKQTVVFPPLNLVKPSGTPASPRKFLDFTTPLSGAFKNIEGYLTTHRVVSEANKGSILAKPLSQNVGNAIDDFVRQNWMTEKYAVRIKKHFGLIQGGRR